MTWGNDWVITDPNNGDEVEIPEHDAEFIVGGVSKTGQHIDVHALDDGAYRLTVGGVSVVVDLWTVRNLLTATLRDLRLRGMA